MKKIILICGLFVFLLSLVMVNQSLAVPSLGVATESIYYGSYDSYLDYFASSFEPISENGGSEGFLIVSSGSELIIFTNILELDIYLLTDSNTYGANSPSFDGEVFEDIDIHDGTQADGYKPADYYGVNLGPVDTTWVLLPEDPFEPSPFYKYTGTIEYSGDIDHTTYFFAVAQYGDLLNFNNKNGEDPDPFSPKTTSAVGGQGGPPIPEPATLLLLGSGLMGVFLFRKRRV